MAALIETMSVTFSSPGTVIGWKLSCGCLDAEGLSFDTYQEAVGYFDAHGFSVELLATCADADNCASEPPSIGPIYEEEPPYVNVSNANAIRLLEVLGLPCTFDMLGDSEPADDFLGRVLMALAVNPADPGLPAIEEGNVIDCGRRPGYLEDRLGQLRDVAAWAAAHRKVVMWG